MEAFSCITCALSLTESEHAQSHAQQCTVLSGLFTMQLHASAWAGRPIGNVQLSTTGRMHMRVAVHHEGLGVELFCVSPSGTEMFPYTNMHVQMCHLRQFRHT